MLCVRWEWERAAVADADGIGDTIQPPNPNRTFKLVQADIVAPNLEAWGLYIDFWIIGDASREFPDDSWVRA